MQETHSKINGPSPPTPTHRGGGRGIPFSRVGPPAPIIYMLPVSGVVAPPPRGDGIPPPRFMVFYHEVVLQVRLGLSLLKRNRICTEPAVSSPHHDHSPSFQPHHQRSAPHHKDKTLQFNPPTPHPQGGRRGIPIPPPGGDGYTPPPPLWVGGWGVEL